jgi:dynactin complex subunit
MSERVRLQGMLAEKALELQQELTRANALVRDLYGRCNPFRKVWELPVDEIVSQAKDLARSVKELQKLRAKVRALQKELGIETEEDE